MSAVVRVLFLVAYAQAATRNRANYSITTESLDAGGTRLGRANYTVNAGALHSSRTPRRCVPNRADSMEKCFGNPPARGIWRRHLH